LQPPGAVECQKALLFTCLHFGEAYAGGLHDRDIDLVRFGYRDYDPEVGKWTAKDPIGFSGGDVDVFGYVQNTPINFVDPSGLLGVPLSAIKKALKDVHKKIGGSLPKGKPGKFDSPQRGTTTKGYRLDPGHPDKSPGDPEAGPHINWWDYTEKKRKQGGPHGAEPIIGAVLGLLGSMVDPFDAIAGELATDEELMQEYYNNHPSPCE
jgi:RHS repeat-associated protein